MVSAVEKDGIDGLHQLPQIRVAMKIQGGQL